MSAAGHYCLHAEVPQAASHRLGELMEACGAVAVTFTSADDEAAFDIATPQTPRWPVVRVSGLFVAETDARTVRNRIAADFSAARCAMEAVPERDWARDSLANFQPRQFGDGLWVCPSWCTPPYPEATNVVLDPGLAFGTGQHATTSMCLDWISRHLPAGARVVDYGCGSGILAIAALKKGARYAWGVDVDPRALSASTDNAVQNRVADRYAALAPEAVPDGLHADVVFANIFANVLLDRQAALSQLVAPNGLILLTGILIEQEARVLASYDRQFRFTTTQSDGWVLLVGHKQI